jgi:hypothetical protein
MIGTNRSLWQVLFGILLVLCLVEGAQAKAVWIAQLDGLGFLVNQSFLLTQNGPSVDGTGDLEFLNLSYQGNLVNVRALQDNDWTQYLPFGIGVFPESHMPQPGTGDQSYLAFVPMFDFPSTAGTVLSIAIPEPTQSVALTLGGLAVAFSLLRRRDKSTTP